MKTVFLITALILISCARKLSDHSDEKIIARIGEKTISLDEFVRRAELTIRPGYCRGEEDFHKRIILNSLIAEKLLAIEAGENNELANNERFQDYLKGRKEQAMRQWLYNHDFYEKVRLDSNEIKNSYKLAGRKYKVAYFTIKDSIVAKKVQDELQQGLSFTEIFQQLEGLEGIPCRVVSWNAPEHEAIHNAIFSGLICKDQVIGPIKIETNFYTVIKILGWTDRVVLIDKESHQRWKDVTEKLKRKHATIQYRKYISKIMRGKRAEFAEDIFYKLVNIVGPFYFKTGKDKSELFNQRFWHKDSEEIILDDIADNIENIRDFPLLRIDGGIWTVRDFEKELNSHTLVFRKRRMKRSEFAEQFKLAIVDMIRDKYITKEAYKKGYDRVNVVERNISMWRDYLSSLYHRNQYLESIGKTEDFHKDHLRIIRQDLNPYIDRLQEKYNDVVEIDTYRFEKIRLTRIDLFVLQRNVPYPIVVPGFPILTTDNKLDYGKKWSEFRMVNQKNSPMLCLACAKL
jgi:hypothetical protein